MDRMLRLAVLPALGILLIAGCSEKEDTSFAGSGTIEATEVAVSARSRGELARATFEEGASVKQGEVIALIDVEDLRLQRRAAAAGLNEIEANRAVLRQEISAAEEGVRQARIARDNSRVTRNRIANLFKEGAATQDRLDRADTELSLAESRVNAAEKQLAAVKARQGTLQAGRERIEENLKVLDNQIEEGSIESPISGVVVESFVEQGEVVNFGSPICTIADLSTVWLTVYIGEADLGKVSLGDTSRVRVGSFPGRTFPGEVTWISPRAEFTPKNVQTRESRADLVYAVKITLPNPEGVFKIGMPAEAYIEGL
ncbi:MAG: HlyD family secretion protein [Candidatus Latescibacterota bacterium]